MVEQFIEGIELTVGVVGNDSYEALPSFKLSRTTMNSTTTMRSMLLAEAPTCALLRLTKILRRRFRTWQLRPMRFLDVVVFPEPT